MLAPAEKTKTVPTAISSRITAAILFASRLPLVSLIIYASSTYKKKMPCPENENQAVQHYFRLLWPNRSRN
jgi:hypothetical protein